MISFAFYLAFLLIFVVFAVYAERKTAAFIQNRLGPMEVGPKGILQTVADLLKMLQKEDIRASAVDIIPYLLAPFIVFAAVFTGFAVLPVNADLSGSTITSGVFFLLAIVSLDVLGILMAGWASNNKYSLYGAMRSVAQIISYEVPLGLSVLCVIIISGTLDLHQMSVLQSGGILSWYIISHPVLIIPFFIFFISGLAESNRTPFDLPESESELIGGYHTEYSGFRWGIFMLSEYGMMLLLSILASILFFGGWNSPMEKIANGPIWSTFWLLSKSLLLIFVQMWVRWTLPRLRVDQLMSLSWKYLTPISIVMLFVCALWKLWLIG
ncbi:NADH dehydrogenase subunit H [Ekhidna lutea]|uniref:NADH-quinone oxidoreductase subunit H n=1 Tax=Ekhidna lutea TaxID=447679 RepID=A0A239HLU0_EKHLU|nr:NADH-quinone oxidoreductase subunit NuoH [Ekhidna lutea]SNS82320.1 NADH dehydrogenase subunit H [Ekhidna lutea]